MRYTCLLIALLAFCGTAVAEELPDHALHSQGAPEDGPGKSLNSDQMASLYLQSPQLVSNGVEKNGMGAVSDENRYLGSNLVEQRQRQRERTQMGQPKPITPAQQHKPAAGLLDVLPFLPALSDYRSHSFH